MALTIEPRELTGGRAWEFTHERTTYRLVSYNGSDKVELFWLDNGQPVARGARMLNGRGSRSVAVEWAGEIAGERVAPEPNRIVLRNSYGTWEATTYQLDHAIAKLLPASTRELRAQFEEAMGSGTYERVGTVSEFLIMFCEIGHFDR